MLRLFDSDILRGQRRSGMVAAQCEHMEWQEPSSCFSRVGGGDRRIADRMGSLLPGLSYRLSVVGGRKEPPHQRARVTSGSVRSQSIPEAYAERQCSPEEQQYDYSGLHS